MGIEAYEPLYVHRSVRLGKNIKLGKNTCLCENVSISDGCILNEAIVYEDCSIGKGCGLYGCIVGRNTVIGENCIIPEGSVLGGSNVLCDGAILKKNTRLKTGRKITEENNMASVSKFKNAMFCDRGVLCGSGDVSPEYFSRLGCVIAQVLARECGCNANAGVMTDGGKYSSVVAELLRAGLRAGGACVYELGKGNEALACFAAMSVVQGVVAYVYTSSENTVIKLIDADGRPVSRQTEQKIEKNFREDKEFEKIQTICASHNFSSVETLYFSTLMNSVRDVNVRGALSDFECSLAVNDSEDLLSRDILEKALLQYGAKVYNKEKNGILCMHLSPDGTNLYVRQNKTDADLFHVGAVLLNNYTPYGDMGLVLPEGTPDIYAGIAQKRKLRVFDGYDAKHDMYGRFIPENAVNSLWLRDGVFAALRLCFLMKSRECTLAQLLSEIPDFAVFTDELVGVSGRSEAMEALSKLDKTDKSSRSDGIRLVLADGTVTVIPGRVAGFKIISEAHSFEAAKELCHKVEDVMRGK
jgi:phosphomannomutase